MHFIFQYLLINKLDKKAGFYIFQTTFLFDIKYTSLIYKISSNHIPLNVEGNLIKL